MSPASPPPIYPGRMVVMGERNSDIVRLVQERLSQWGCGPAGEPGTFNAETRAAVKLFQARFPDCLGRPLNVDGKVGPLTWPALFGCAASPSPAVGPSGLARAAIATAISQIGVREQPPGSNRGPEVDLYLRSVGLDPTKGSYAWCAAFVYWCYSEGAARLGVPNPAIRTAGVVDHWRKAGNSPVARRVKGADAAQDPTLVLPGAVFTISVGRGLGHMGFVETVEDGNLVTVEGNTNDAGSREGIGVFRRHGRKVTSVNLGYVVYG